MTLTIGYLNLYGGNRTPGRAVAAMLAARPDSLGWGEAPRWLDLLRATPRYRLHLGAGGRDRRRGHRDTPISTRRDHPSIGSAALQISEAASPARLAPDRWLTASLFPAAGLRVAHLNVHPNAAVAGRRAAVPRVREFIDSMRALDQTMRYYRTLRGGMALVVTGDLNFPPGLDAAPGWDDRWSPWKVLDRHGLDHYGAGIDAIAWDAEVLTLAASRVIRQQATGSDHPGIIVNLARR